MSKDKINDKPLDNVGYAVADEVVQPTDEVAKDDVDTSIDNKDTKKVEKVVEFEYGDLTIECGICGHKEIIDTNVKGGITLVLPTTDTHKLQLVCDKCKKSNMIIYFQDAVNPPIEDAVELGSKGDKPDQPNDEEIKPEDVKLKVVKDESDDPKEESK